MQINEEYAQRIADALAAVLTDGADWPDGMDIAGWEQFGDQFLSLDKGLFLRFANGAEVNIKIQALTPPGVGGPECCWCGEGPDEEMGDLVDRDGDPPLDDSHDGEVAHPGCWTSSTEGGLASALAGHVEQVTCGVADPLDGKICLLDLGHDGDHDKGGRRFPAYRCSDPDCETHPTAEAALAADGARVHTGLAAHGGYAEHSHEVRADHLGVAKAGV